MTVGKGISEGKVEFKLRSDEEKEEITVEEAINRICDLVRANR